MANRKNGRDKYYGRPWQRIRAKVLAGQPQYCYLCNNELGPIRYDLKYPHPLSPSVDHVVAAANFDHLPEPERSNAMYDINNLKPCHKVCNDRKQTSPAPQKSLQPNPGQEW